jgi:hypothetical protein
MIIKTKRSYTNQRYKQLIEYILSDKGRADQQNTFTILHNLKSTNKDEVIQEFIENDQYRKKRTRGVVLYHEIVSFHPDSRSVLNLEILEDIARKFIELRGNNALCLAKPHIENDNIHIHFCFSGTEYKSSKTIRLDNTAFKSVRINMELYQQKYQDLNSSIVYLNKWQKNRLMEQSTTKQSENEFQLKTRTGKPSKKDLIRALVSDCYNQSSGKEDFFQRLLQQGLELYKYRDKINGLKDKDGRKYRFSSLSLGDKEMTLLEKNSDRMLELQRMQKHKEKSRLKELER